MNARSFIAGSVLCVVVLAALLGIALASGPESRPEGEAEDWLAAVSDMGRDGIRDDALARAEKIGPVGLAAPLVPADATGDDRHFDDLEVGKAAVGTEGEAMVARVPFRVTQHAESGDAPELDGTLVLREVDGSGWRVEALSERRPGESVPSEGGEPPSSAPGIAWAGALGAGVLLTAMASVLVEWARRSAGRAYSGA